MDEIQFISKFSAQTFDLYYVAQVLYGWIDLWSSTKDCNI